MPAPATEPWVWPFAAAATLAAAEAGCWGGAAGGCLAASAPGCGTASTCTAPLPSATASRPSLRLATPGSEPQLSSKQRWWFCVGVSKPLSGSSRLPQGHPDELSPGDTSFIAKLWKSLLWGTATPLHKAGRTSPCM